jgi:hypothetical protein
MSEKNDQFFWGTLFLGNFIFFGTFKDISYRKSVFFKDIYSILDPQEILIDAREANIGSFVLWHPDHQPGFGGSTVSESQLEGSLLEPLRDWISRC